MGKSAGGDRSTNSVDAPSLSGNQDMWWFCREISEMYLVIGEPKQHMLGLAYRNLDLVMETE